MLCIGNADDASQPARHRAIVKVGSEEFALPKGRASKALFYLGGKKRPNSMLNSAS